MIPRLEPPADSDKEFSAEIQIRELKSCTIDNEQVYGHRQEVLGLFISSSVPKEEPDNKNKNSLNRSLSELCFASLLLAAANLPSRQGQTLPYV